MKRQKSIISQTASISAWCAVFDWLSIVAAFSVVAPRAGEELGGAQEDRCPLVPRHPRPLGVRGRRGVDRLLDVLGAALRDVGEDVALAMGLHRLERRVRVDVLATDDHRDRDPLALHLVQAELEGGALRRAGRVGPDGLVVVLGRGEDAVCAHGGDCRRPPRLYSPGR